MNEEELEIENRDITIYHHEAFFWPGNYEISILNRDKDNVVIENMGRVLSGKSDKLTEEYSIPRKDIDKLLELISKADLLFNKEIEFEENEFLILDGQTDLFFVNNLKEHVLVEESNFVMEHEGMDFDTKAGQLVAIHDLVKKILRKNRIRI